MEHHFSHASRVLATKPLPLETTHLVITGNQPALTKLFTRRFKKLTDRGELGVEHARLVDRRPVDMKPSTTIYNPPDKARVRGTQSVAYDHPLLTIAQRSCRTNTTKGEAMDMKNKIADQKTVRKIRYLAVIKAEKS